MLPVLFDSLLATVIAEMFSIIWPYIYIHSQTSYIPVNCWKYAYNFTYKSFA